MGGWRGPEDRMGMLGNVLRFGAGEGAMQGVEIGEKGMREEGEKIMGPCFTSEGVIITRCEFRVFRERLKFSSSQDCKELVSWSSESSFEPTPFGGNI